ncbi:MAG: hypothetical protein WKG07_27470 [Hymenobacter sp.]
MSGPESYGFFPTLADKLLGRAFCRAFDWATTRRAPPAPPASPT